jgi:hypothetical protein
LKFLEVVLFLSLLTQAIDLDSNILPFILDVMLQAPFSPPHLTFLAFFGQSANQSTCSPACSARLPQEVIQVSSL